MPSLCFVNKVNQTITQSRLNVGRFDCDSLVTM